MSNTLSASDYAKLASYASAGDRYDYWNLLAAHGDMYARLALSVVDGDGLSGFIGANYAASFAPSTSPLSDGQSTLAWWSVGKNLVKADYNARINLNSTDQPLNLSFQTIQVYHQAVFAAVSLPAVAWTPYIPFGNYISANTAASWAAAEPYWQSMIDGDAVQAGKVSLGLIAYLNSSIANSEAVLSWSAENLLLANEYYGDLAQAGSNVQKMSLRNADYVEGWTYLESTQQWTSTTFSAGEAAGSVIYADPAKTASLNAERQSRITNFGANVLYIGDTTQPGLNEGGLTSIYSGQQWLSGGTLNSGSSNVWADGNGSSYTFAGSPGTSGLGTLTIVNSALGGSFGSVVLQNFNLSAATFSSSGYDGIHLAGSLKLSASSTVFGAGGSDGFDVLFDVTTTTSETVTVRMSGAMPSDFEVLSSGQLLALNADGSFTLTLQAGKSDVAFSLLDVTKDDGTSDIASGAQLMLTASAQTPGNPDSTSLSSSPLSVQYLPRQSDTAPAPKGMTNIVGVNGVYVGDGGDDQVVAAFANNNINLRNSVNDSIVGSTGTNTIVSGTGNDVITLQGTADQVTLGGGNTTLNGGSGNETVMSGVGDAIVNGHGGTDVILLGSGNNEVYAGSQTSVTNAITQLAAAAASGKQGDLISVLDGNDTVVGGTGNDLINAGSGHVIAVMGPGQDTFLGGWELTYESGTWSTAMVNNVLVVYNVVANPEAFVNSFPQPYNGNFILEGQSTLAAGASNETVFGGTGNDLIELGNGSNYVEAGSGNTVVDGGMGNDTIVGGSGFDTLRGGGGNTNIQGGSGSQLIFGGDGNNTIIGGSGNATISAASDSNLSRWAGDTLEQNYVFTGSGNDQVFGSAGYDTLIAGSGNSTLQGGLGTEYIVGGSGRDVLIGGTGNNTLVAGSGQTTMEAYGSSTTASWLYGGAGVDLIEGGSGQNYLFAGDGGTAGNATSVLGSSSDSSSQTTIQGGLGVDLIEGGAGSTLIYAGDGGTASATTSVLAGSGATTVYGGDGVDFIQGGSGADVLNAGDGGVAGGATTVLGLAGASTLVGGAGLDVLYDLQSGHDLLVAGSGSDTLVGRGQDTLIAGPGSDKFQNDGGTLTIESSDGEGDVVVTGSAGTENLAFGTTMAPEDMTGSANWDQYGQSYLALDTGRGTVSLQGGFTGSLGTATFQDIGSVTGDALMLGAFSSDQQFSNNASTLYLGVTAGDTLGGGSGQDDTVSGWGVNETIHGGTSSGSYIYSDGSAASIVGGSGFDTIVAAGANAAVAAGHSGAEVTLSGANSSVTGGAGPNWLTASGTGDTLVGGAGANQFYVESTSTTVISANASGGDAATATTNFTLPANVNVLNLSGSSNIVGTANGGADTLIGGAGQDTLVAGTTGADLLVGGSNSTTFVINNAADAIQENNDSNADTVLSQVSFTLPTNVNVLTLTGASALNGTANTGADTLVSNSGVDTLVGGGNDLFVVNNAADAVTEALTSANDTLQAAVNATLASNVNTLVLTGTAALTGKANNGADTLLSNTGIDTFIGGTGNDIFVVQNTADVIQDLSTTASNAVVSSVSFTLPTNVDTLTLTGSTALQATGNAAADIITANSGNDTLAATSATAPTTLLGGTGNDVFVINNAGDAVVNANANSNDTLSSSVSVTAPTNVNTVVLTGSANLQATANNAGDTLVSNYGVDTLVGGAGNDVFIVNNAADVLLNVSSTDTILSSIGLTVPSSETVLALTGAAAVKVTTNSGNDSVVGNAGADTLVATSGQDTLVAGMGLATLVAGTGNDVFVVNNVADVVSLSGATGADTLLSSVNWTLPAGVTTLTLTGSANLTGRAISSNNLITGNSGQDTLNAGSGLDTLVAGTGATTLVGGTGVDTFVINSSVDVIEGISSIAGNAVVSSVADTMQANISTLTLTGYANLLGTGNAGNDTIQGNSGNDTLVAGSGIADLLGGTGADLFVVDNIADVVSDAYYGMKGAADTISSSVNYTLPSTVDNLVLTGAANLVGTANQNADSLVGNSGADTLVAGLGDDTLVSGSGVTLLKGGAGNDVFIVNNAADVVTLASANQNNVLMSSVGLTLPTNVNQLVLLGSGSIVGTANSADDLLRGNAGADTLVAMAGKDTLVAGSGVATLVGGAGNDTFVVDNTGDFVVDSFTTTSNVVLSSATFVLPANVNALTLTGSANISATGNSAADTLIAGAGNDTLVAGSGIATLIGGTGATTFVVNSTADAVQNASAAQANAVQSSVSYSLPINVNLLTLTGAAALTGTANAGQDTLVSNSGQDTLIGGVGNDTFVVNNVNDSVRDASTTTNNVIEANVNVTLATNVNTLIMLAGANLTGTANAGTDTLVSNTGIDTLTGGSGNDTFVVNNGADVITDSSTSAQNTVLSSVNYVAPANVNSLTLTGSANLSASGNAGADLITANAGNDTLTAVSTTAASTLVGGSGNDLFVVNNAGDTVQNAYSGASDTIQSSVSYSAVANVNTVALTGTANLTATGNPTGGNTLISNSGVDTLIGGAGDDVFMVNNANDVLLNVTTGDTVIADVPYQLTAANVQMQLSGTNAIAASMSGANDTLVSNTGADTLTALASNETLVGGAGGNTFVVVDSSDVIQNASQFALNTLISSGSYTLPGSVDTLTLTGTNAVYAAGNDDIVNVLTANGGSDVLTGTAAMTTLIGGAGADTLYASSGNNVIHAGSGGTLAEQTWVYGANSSGGRLVTDTIYGDSGVNVLIGGAGYNTIVGGSGTTRISASGLNNLVNIGASGTTSAPTVVNVGGEGATSQTTINGGTGYDVIYGGSGADLINAGTGVSTIYAGSGSDSINGGSGYDVIYGGSGADLINAGTGVSTIYAGSGSDSIYGAAGSLLIDTLSGSDLLVADAGSETLQGIGSDTLVAGTGSDQMISSGVNATYVFNPGFGNVTIAGHDKNGDYVSEPGTIAFGTGLSPSALSFKEVTGGAYTKTYSLEINVGTSSILVAGGLAPGVIQSVQFAGGTTESLAQLLNAQIPGTSLYPDIGGYDVLSAGNGQSVQLSDSDYQAWAFGDDDSVVDPTSTASVEITAYGNNDTLAGAAILATGSSDQVALTGATGRASLMGANDTLTANGGAYNIWIANASDLVQIGASGSGIDTLTSAASYVLPAGIGDLILDPSKSDLKGASNSQGGYLIAKGASDTLVGGSGRDTLSAQGATDVLVGGSGVQTYLLSQAGQTIVAGAGAPGLNAVVAAFSYALGGEANTLTLTGGSSTGTANSGNDTLVATGLYDTLVAGAGNDALIDQSSGPVTMIAGAAQDTFVVANANDFIQNVPAAANDSVQSSVNFTLPANVNALTLTGTGWLSGVSNSGNDVLNANSGNDTLTAGSGNDTLVAGLGVDTFVFNAGFGHELVRNSTSTYALQFGAGLIRSNLTFSAVVTSTGPAVTVTQAGGGSVTLQGGLAQAGASTVNFGDGTSATLAQLIVPTGRATVSGSAGNLILSNVNSDSIKGGTGKDTIVAWGSNDTLAAGSGGAVIYSEGANGSAMGSGGADTLTAVGGGSILVGGSGAEVFVISDSATSVSVNGGAGVDTIMSSVSDTLPAGVDVLLLTGNAALTAVGNALNDTLIANAGADTLTAGGGLVTLVGGQGTDLFVINNPADVVTNPYNAAADMIEATGTLTGANFVLPAGVSGLDVEVSGDTVTGNAQGGFLSSGLFGPPGVYSGITLKAVGGNNDIVSYSQYSALDAGSGNDTLNSAEGFSTIVTGAAVDTVSSTFEYDSIFINNSDDVISELGQSDTLLTSVSYNLAIVPAYNSSLIWDATGSANVVENDAIGATVSLHANAGNDTLIGAGALFASAGGTGLDTLIGTGHSDLFTVTNVSDVIIASSFGNASMYADVSYTLPAYVYTMRMGADSIVGTANSANDLLTTYTATFTHVGDTLVGGSGNDTLQSSGDGKTIMVAGTGTDSLVSLGAQDVFVFNAGFGQVEAQADTSSPPTVLFGSSISASSLTASSVIDSKGQAALLVSAVTGNVTLDGAFASTNYQFQFGSGPMLSLVQFLAQIRVSNSTLSGATGNLILNGTNAATLSLGSGNDTLYGSGASDTLLAGIGNQVLGSYGTNASLVGGVGNDTLEAFGAQTVLTAGGANTLKAFGNAETLVGGSAAATMIRSGGSGDVFVINNSADVIQTPYDNSVDTVSSSVDFTLTENNEVLVFTGSAALFGAADYGNNTFISNTGVDTFSAGPGNDLFVLNNAADVVSVAAGDGVDTLQASFNYVLPANVNTLVLTGSAALTGAGNAVANVIYANSGNDTLTAGSGKATLVGGAGNDVFVVNNVGDYVVNNSTSTSDTIHSSVSFALPSNVNALVLTGSTALTGTGNSATDLLDASATTGKVTLSAGSGTDTLLSGSGIDSLVGGATVLSNDLFVINNASDVVVVGSTHGTDTIQSAFTTTLAANVNALVMTGAGAISGTANAANDFITAATTSAAVTLNGGAGTDTLVAGTGADVLTAGAGIDSLVGGTGNDKFVINNTSDAVLNSFTTNSDTLSSSVTYTLPTNVNTLVLTGTGAISGSGNGANDLMTASSSTGAVTLNAGNFADTLVAGSGADVLVSGTGVDSLVGGTGNDLFVLTSAADVVSVGTTHGVDSIKASFNDTLAANVGTLVLTGTGALMGTGNSLADTLSANSGADTLVAGTGLSTMIGGTGNDVFVINAIGDAVTVTSSSVSDTIQSSVSYTLPTNVQYLKLTGGTAALTGTGNTATSLVVGNTGNDTLSGGTGVAVLEAGMAGAQVLKAAGNQAALIGGGASDTLTGGAYKDFFAAGKVGDTITTGAKANVIAFNKGDGATIIAPISGASNVLSLGAGVDTEALTLTKSGNNLVLNDGVAGDSITFTNWFSSTTDQTTLTLQVVEAASASYNSSGTDVLRNKPVEEFNFATLVSQFTTAGSPSAWALSQKEAADTIASSATAAYGGDLAYYDGLNGNLTGMNLSAAQSTLANASYATGMQTIDSWASISSGAAPLAVGTGPVDAAAPLVDTVPAANTRSRVDPTTRVHAASVSATAAPDGDFASPYPVLSLQALRAALASPDAIGDAVGPTRATDATGTFGAANAWARLHAQLDAEQHAPAHLGGAEAIGQSASDFASLFAATAATTMDGPAHRHVSSSRVERMLQ